MKDIIKKIIEKIDEKNDNSILLSDNTFEINKEHFYEIKNIESCKTISFIDGGSQEILNSPSISLFFNRIYYTIYKNNKRIKNNVYEFFTLISTTNKKEKIFYTTDYFFTKNKISLKNYEFDSMDKKLISSNKRAKISTIGNVIRRFAELKLASIIESYYVVIDGSLETTYPYENELLNNLKNKNLVGLSKTTDTITSTGGSVNYVLLNSIDKHKWYYKINENTFFAKLHKNSNYVFRLDSFSNNFDELISLLEKNSCDPIFFGYPYGLVEADNFARVSNKEVKILKIKLSTIKEFEKIDILTKSSDAHFILDSIS